MPGQISIVEFSGFIFEPYAEYSEGRAFFASEMIRPDKRWPAHLKSDSAFND